MAAQQLSQAATASAAWPTSAPALSCKSTNNALLVRRLVDRQAGDWFCARIPWSSSPHWPRLPPSPLSPCIQVRVDRVGWALLGPTGPAVPASFSGGEIVLEGAQPRSHAGAIWGSDGRTNALSSSLGNPLAEPCSCHPSRAERRQATRQYGSRQLTTTTLLAWAPGHSWALLGFRDPPAISY